MRIRSILISAGITALLLGCNKQEPPKPPAYKVTSTLREVMSSMVMPSADVLWNAVSSSITDKGVEEKAPKTEEEWKAVRGHAVTLLEASDLILIPGRHVASPGEVLQDPNKEQLTADQIDAMIQKDPDSWSKMANALHDSVLPALKAIDAKNTMALSDAGGGIDKACEDCHLKYWYPKDAKK